ncbi:hypothetical protein [Pedobacter miscanthi]|uniref:Uncharacterized protein n=1 Tax=Pedobacter miscanthi TaxID=2259170 RepID=A0A366L511_9SPHI|nr:hypothetical protein [Pedobacter miscanthi]RBQ08957.1 hypothetical protein DRW42_07045 [Pedobacter miscanthi]
MTWTQFIIYLIGAYSFYYGANLFFDYYRTAGTGDSIDTGLISVGLSSADLPRKIAMEDLDPGFSEIDYFVGDTDSDPVDSPIVSSGGISIRELFELARDESIEFTRAVSF